jgi:EAL domain-containing protein (putative c-di-GMP-specific phosphodiesterase class I)
VTAGDNDRVPTPSILDVIATGGVGMAFQPVVDLESREVLGYEALLRGPEGTELATPLAMLSRAAEQGVLDRLDLACRRAAVTAALDGGLGSGVTLFVNVEPDAEARGGRGITLSPQDADLFDRAGQELRVVLEVTEREVVTSPAALLRTVDWARERSWGIAVDDLGADPMSLAMMPFLEPDVIKLDLRLIQERPSADIGQVVSAVLAQAERTGATILAEGIEIEEHLEAAMAMGATIGQGWLLGRPAPLPTGDRQPPRPSTTIPLLRAAPPRVELTPFAVVRAARPIRRGNRALLEGIARHLEEQALAWHDRPVILSTFHLGEELSAETAARYEQLAKDGSFVVVIRPDEPATPLGVRGTTFSSGHRLAPEWCVIVIGAHYAGALVARDLGDRDGRRTYDFAVTHDRQVVVDAGRALLRNVEPLIST